MWPESYHVKNKLNDLNQFPQRSFPRKPKTNISFLNSEAKSKTRKQFIKNKFEIQRQAADKVFGTKMRTTGRINFQRIYVKISTIISWSTYKWDTTTSIFDG